ncbi:MAG TPA: hypothetical protein VMT38_11645 [Terracidiphilus sp.]|nr:hypothetical protein [Terracidiphilus sp.]
MHDLPDEIERLEKRMAVLEQRVHALEHPLEARWPHSSQEAEVASAAPITSTAPAALAGSMFSVLGKAMLGVAGAYVLRAVEESSSLPKLAVAVAGIAYAFAWLVWAARVRAGPRFTSTIYAGTSALILAPMVWELTLRFKVFSPSITAGVICAFALAAIGLASGDDRLPVLRTVCIAAAGLALALAFASRTLMPFVVALLVLVAVCEFVPRLERLPEVRALVALAADAAIWVQIYVYFAPQSSGADYPALSRMALLAPGVAIFLLFAASVCWQTLAKHRRVSVFAVVQTTIAFLLAAVSLADFGPQGSIVILGVVCLALSGAIYAAVFAALNRAGEPRNAAVFSAWGAMLLLAGSFLCLTSLAIVLLLGATAVAATFIGSRTNRIALQFYGLVFLLAGAAESGLPGFLISAWSGTPKGMPSAVIWFTACAAILCYGCALPRTGESRLLQTLHLSFAALATAAVAALLVEGVAGLAALHIEIGAHHLAFIRTLTLCGVALGLEFAGAHWRRIELTRLGYAAMALVAIKLVMEDLRHGHLAYIAASIFLVALTLIAAPRMARARQTVLGK